MPRLASPQERTCVAVLHDLGHLQLPELAEVRPERVLAASGAQGSSASHAELAVGLAATRASAQPDAPGPARSGDLPVPSRAHLVSQGRPSTARRRGAESGAESTESWPLAFTRSTLSKMLPCPPFSIMACCSLMVDGATSPRSPFPVSRHRRSSAATTATGALASCSCLLLHLREALRRSCAHTQEKGDGNPLAVVSGNQALRPRAGCAACAAAAAVAARLAWHRVWPCSRLAKDAQTETRPRRTPGTVR